MSSRIHPDSVTNMASRARPIDRGTRLGRAGLERIGRELREARIDRGLSIDAVGAAVGISNAELSRIERALAPRVPYITLARCAAVVGLDFVSRTYSGGTPLRDLAHARLLADFRANLHGSLQWSTEVPLPIPGDQRAWDGMARGEGWRFGVEVETAPHDGQALIRRLTLKLRDDPLDGILLVVRDTRRVRGFLAEAGEQLSPLFPVNSRRVLADLRTGSRPAGNAVIVLRARREPGIEAALRPGGRSLAGRTVLTPHV